MMRISAVLLLVLLKDIGITVSTNYVGATSQDGESSTRIYRSTSDTLVVDASNNSIINISNITVLSSTVMLQDLENITVIGDSIDCNGRVSVKFVSSKNITIKAVTWLQCGTPTNPAISFQHSSTIKIQNCSFLYSKGQVIALSGVSGNAYITDCQFTHNNDHVGHGGAMHVYIAQPENHIHLNLIIDRCNFTLNGAARSVVYVDGIPSYNHLTIKDSVFAQNEGVPIYISHTSLQFNDSIFFQQNKAIAGGGIYSNQSSIVFNDRCNAIFTRNSVQKNGGCIFLDDSNISFIGTSTANFTSNNATVDGGAIHCNGRSNITFSESSTVLFSNNTALGNGGAVSWTRPFVAIDRDVRINTKAENVAQSTQNSVISFHGNATVIFDHNSGTQGGALYFENGHGALFNENTSVTFTNNKAKRGGAMYFKMESYLACESHTTMNFSHNYAELNGGAIVSFDSTNILFGGNSYTLFTDNTAGQDGAAIYSILGSTVKFVNMSIVTLQDNTAMEHGGAIFSFKDSDITFEEQSNVTFDSNTAEERGGAVYSIRQSTVSFKGRSYVVFTNNKAHISGGAIASSYDGVVCFKENSSLTFCNNSCTFFGGAFNVFYNTTAGFMQHSSVMFQNNTATFGGAMRSYDSSNITIEGSSDLTFIGNKASYDGGGVYCGHNSDLKLKGNSSILFNYNTARDGGAISILQSNMTFAENSFVQFNHNTATQRGGGLYLGNKFTLSFNDSSNVSYWLNYADQYGGAIFGNAIENIDSKITVDNTTYTDFKSNTASAGDHIYMDIPTSCDKTCRDKIIIMDSSNDTINHNFTNNINTPPNKLVLHDPAVCISHDNNYDMKHATYLITEIMLGQEIKIDACVLDFYDKNASSMQFTVKSNTNRTVDPNFVLISCNKFQGIIVKGDKVCDPLNVSVTIMSHIDSQSDSKKISIELITELSPCHPGFYYNSTSQHCECYDKTDIVSCSDDHTSIIKRGYWFGPRPGTGCNCTDCTPTISVCPNNYCSFSCCETANGYYQLSPERRNQCNSHRSGTACGSCEEGYTLSFDSVECVNTSECTTGWTILVVMVSLIYWMVIVILVFILTYYNVGISYMYAITYYYSMLDIVLSQNLYQSKGLFTTISIVSSFAKITPKFLGQICFVEDMIGIDQEFIHYTHPLAVSLIIIAICQWARVSYRFSSFISRAIIRTICFLLLLSYTSVATTSLLLLRMLIFQSDNKVYIYTYLSPDVEYFHGQHLPYFIVAVLCTLVIVIGLPLLLLLEPFLNHKINFTRVKPLLDQFQGCYKDKYRCFAAYYMVCRILIILIVIANPSNYINAQLLLASVSTILALIQLIVRPYEKNILNIFDGLVLHTMTLVALTPLTDIYNRQFFLSITYILIILPVLSFAVMELFINKDVIKKIVMLLRDKFNRTANNPGGNDCYLPIDGYVVPRNVIMLDIHDENNDVRFQESFIEVMDDIKD